MRATFAADHVIFRGYPFPPASVRRVPRLSADAIDDVDSTANPPEIRTRAGETLFLPGSESAALGAFALKNALPNVSRFDAWGLLLEPYLDTELSSVAARHDLERLRDAGFSADEVAALRARVAPAIGAYNAMVWEWGHLGLYDVLRAMRDAFCLDMVKNRAWPPRYRGFYKGAMTIAARGRLHPL